MEREIDFFIIRPVRDVTGKENKDIARHVKELEETGRKIYDPFRDNPYQETDTIGLTICNTNKEAIRNSRFGSRVCYKRKSEGSLFDIGMTFAMEKPVTLMNGEEVRKCRDDGFTKFLLDYENIYDKHPPVEEYDVFIIGSQDAAKEGGYLNFYVPQLESFGIKYYIPGSGDSYVKIRESMRKAKAVHVYWTPHDRESIFCFGMAFALAKPIYLINRHEVEPTERKSFNNVLLALDRSG